LQYCTGIASIGNSVFSIAKVLNVFDILYWHWHTADTFLNIGIGNRLINANTRYFASCRLHERGLDDRTYDGTAGAVTIDSI